MSEQQQEPKPKDAVLGGETTPQRGAVLGGIEGLKRRLESSDQQERITALQQAVDYGHEGLKLVNEAKIGDQFKLVENSNTPVEVLQEVARNINCPEALLQKLAQDEKSMARKVVARCIIFNCPAEILQQLAQDKDMEVRCGVAENIDCPVEILQQLAQDKDMEVRCGVAENIDCPVEILQQLAQDKDIEVRAEVGKNPIAILDEL